MRLVQIRHAVDGRRTALVDHDKLQLLNEAFPSLCQLVWEALRTRVRISEIIGNNLSTTHLSYDSVYSGKDDWKLMPSFDHHADLMQCVVSGTGLTHKASAENRASMHRKQQQETLSDSMKIYLLGEEGGKPAAGSIGVQPEWFYKGNGSILRGHGDFLDIPPYAEDGGEEAEIAGIYMIAPDRTPVRVGFTLGNEFSDHVMEAQNYLYLAPSKLRSCAIGPELVLGEAFDDIPGSVFIERNGASLWKREIRTGEKYITHSLENLEHHHFKYEQHRIPGQVHIHFFGTFGLSYSEGIRLEDGDIISISMKGFGRPLRNTVRNRKGRESLIQVYALY